MSRIVKCEICHEEKPHKAFGWCVTCYGRIKQKQNKEVRLKKKGLRLATVAQVFKYYTNRKYSAPKIAKLLNISPSGVRLILKRLKVKMRKDDWAKQGKSNLRHGFYRLVNKYKLLHPTCEVCGWKYGVDIHHILPIRNGGTNTSDNIIALCPNHHRLADKELVIIKKGEGIWVIKDLTIEPELIGGEQN